MPVEYGAGERDDRRKWPVKVLTGRFSETKKIKLDSRYARRRIRVVFRNG